MRINGSLTLLVSVFSVALTVANAQSQLPPPGKYDTTSFAADRAAIRKLAAAPPFSPAQHCNDDYIATGPEGRVSYGYEQWKAGFEKAGRTFKSIRPVPGTEIIRIYNGQSAVRNVVLDVVFATANGDVPNQVRRTEVFVKQDGRWCWVSGQGTRILSQQELEAVRK